MTIGGTLLALVPGEDSFSAVSQPEPVQTQTEKPDAPLIGANGNIFNLAGIASRTLKAAGMREQANQMYQRITASGSYGEALNIIGEYVNFTEADRPEQSNDVDEQFGMKMEYNVPIELDKKLRNLNELDRIRVRNYPKKEGSNRYEKTAVYSRVQNKGGTGTP